MSPRVSVLMPVRNGRQYLAAAIESILAQTFADFEFLIVDDGSHDGSSELLREFARADARVQVFSATGRGLVSGLNQALAAARGEYLARMDGDDIALPERFAAQVEYLDAHAELVGLGTAVEMIDPDGESIAVCKLPVAPAELARELIAGRTPGLWHPTAMLRASAVRQVGGYRAPFETAEDRDLWLRLTEIGQLANLPQVLLKYRQHLAAVGSARRVEQRHAVTLALHQARERRGLPHPPKRFRFPRPPGDSRITWIRKALKQGNYATAAKHTWALASTRWWSPRTWLLLARVSTSKPLWRQIFSHVAARTAAPAPIVKGLS